MIARLVFVVIACWVLWRFALKEMHELYTDKRKRPPYVEYERNAALEHNWYNAERVGHCHYCGMDDAPIVFGWKDPNHHPMCRHCAELYAIIHHLKLHEREK